MIHIRQGAMHDWYTLALPPFLATLWLLNRYLPKRKGH